MMGMQGNTTNPMQKTMMMMQMMQMMKRMRGSEGDTGTGTCNGKGMCKEGKPSRTAGSMSDPDLDMWGKPGPHGEDPESGRWSYESKGIGAGKKWRWKPASKIEERLAK